MTMNESKSVTKDPICGAVEDVPTTLRWYLGCAFGFETVNISKPQFALQEKSREFTQKGSELYAKA